MRNCYTLNKNEIQVVDFDKYSGQYTTELQFDKRHLFCHFINNTYSLIVNSFNNALEIVDSKLANLILNHNCYGIDNRIVNYYNSRLSRGDIEGRHNTSLLEVQNNNPLHIALCPTFSCNLKCTYCYQQHSSDVFKTFMTSEKLDKILAWIRKITAAELEINPDAKIVLELFGGEPLQKGTYKIVERILNFGRSNNFLMGVTTNLVDLDTYLKLFAIHRGYISRVCTTIDGGKHNHDSRRRSKNNASTFETIVSNVNKLLKLRIPVQVGINIDRNNLPELDHFFDIAEKNGWIDNDLVELEIGRVDDRLYEIKYDKIISESELLYELVKFHRRRGLPKNIRLAFLKSSLFIADKLGFTFNQNESGRALYHYCWATTPTQKVLYVGPELELYRCTYTTGRKEFSIGTIEDNFCEVSLNKWYLHQLLNIKKCQECKLGGYCSGGCYLSSQKDFDRHCQEEYDNHNCLIEKIVIPFLCQKLKQYEQTQIAF